MYHDCIYLVYLIFVIRTYSWFGQTPDSFPRTKWVWRRGSGAACPGLVNTSWQCDGQLQWPPSPIPRPSSVLPPACGQWWVLAAASLPSLRPRTRPRPRPMLPASILELNRRPISFRAGVLAFQYFIHVFDCRCRDVTINQKKFQAWSCTLCITFAIIYEMSLFGELSKRIGKTLFRPIFVSNVLSSAFIPNKCN